MSPGTAARIRTCDVWWGAQVLHTSVTLSGASVYPTGAWGEVEVVEVVEVVGLHA